MFDLGWMELTVIAVTALIVVGPKDLPAMFKKVGYFAGRVRGMARDFQRAMENAADETGLKETAKMINSVSSVKDPKVMADSFLKDTNVEEQNKAATSKLNTESNNGTEQTPSSSKKKRKEDSNLTTKKLSK